MCDYNNTLVSTKTDNSMSLSYSLGMKGLKMGPVGKNDSDGTDAQEDKMASNVVCKCEKVTGTSYFQMCWQHQDRILLTHVSLFHRAGGCESYET